jgi:N-carbamoylputrescine amidase
VHKIICTQEMFASQYFCQARTIASFPSPRRSPARAPTPRARSRRSTASSSSPRLFEKRASGLYHNTAAIIDADGSLMGVYRKMHIPDDPLYYEKFYFTPGDLGFKAWNQARNNRRAHLLGPVVSPKRARLTAMQGAEILFYPTAIGWHPKEKGRIRRGPAPVLGNDPALARRRQRLLRRVDQSHRPRGDRKRRR